ncbi:hypothetical protein MNBD_GAMMA11-1997 [hydrothermal vent metagenome]|uniref:DUF4129 domain-containing protein n=1 Tax=hydrothermal vent metagenome TaxID=652676 RepID=A0A3B0X039_9ZZZZ
MFKRVSPVLFLILTFQLASVYAMSDESEIREVDKKNWLPEIKDTRADIAQSKSVITDIKSKEPFINIQKEKKLVFNNREKKEEKPENEPDFGFLAGVFGLFAMLVEAMFWVIPIVVIFFLYRYREYWLGLIQGESRKEAAQPLPDTLFGLDIRQHSLPDNIEQAALQLWQQNKCREAVSLLYRGSLSSLFNQYRFELSAGATEQDCIRKLEFSEQQAEEDIRTNPQHITDITARISHFKQLTQVWIKVAYAHRLPDERTFRRLCENWNQRFMPGFSSRNRPG